MTAWPLNFLIELNSQDVSTVSAEICSLGVGARVCARACVCVCLFVLLMAGGGVSPKP